MSLIGFKFKKRIINIKKKSKFLFRFFLFIKDIEGFIRL